MAQVNSGKDSGTLIVFEGLSGSGKSENIKKLQTHLDAMPMKNAVMEWNSNKLIRRIVRVLQNKKLLTSNIYSLLQWMGFLVYYITKIKPLLRKKYIVIADRYAFTGLVRDAVNGGSLFIGKRIWPLIRKPNLIFF